MKNKNQIPAIISAIGILALSFQTVKAQWVQTGPYKKEIKIITLAASGNAIIAATLDRAIFLSTNNGSYWKAAGKVKAGEKDNSSTLFNITSGPLVYSFAFSGDNIFAGTDSGVFLSTNHGTNWTANNSGLAKNVMVRSVAVSGSTIFAGTDSGVFISTNNGANWTETNAQFQYVDHLVANRGTILAGTRGSGVYVSSDTGNIWVQTLKPDENCYIRSFAVSDGNVFAATDNLNLKAWDAVYLSTDNGKKWQGISNLKVNSFAVSGNNIFAGTDSGVFRSDGNDGATWTAVDSGMTNLRVNAFTASGNNIFAGTDSGIFRSTDDGANWTAMSNLKCYSLAVSEGVVFAGAGDGIYRSTDQGKQWTFIDSGLPSRINYSSLVVSGSNILAATHSWSSYGVYRSTDTGTSWAEVDTGMKNKYIKCFLINGNNIFAGTDSGVFLSTNNGATWTDVNSGLPGNTWGISLAVIGSNIFVGTDKYGVWRRPLSEVLTNVDKPTVNPPRCEHLKIIRSMAGTKTGIAFSLNRPERVNFTVYDLSGCAVKMLAHKRFESGHQTIWWDTRSCAPGCYMIKMQAGKNISVQKMTIAR